MSISKIKCAALPLVRAPLQSVNKIIDWKGNQWAL